MASFSMQKYKEVKYMAGRPKSTINKNKKIKNEEDKIVERKSCSMQLSKKCQEEHEKENGRKLTDFYMTINKNLFRSKKVHICKDCIKEYCYKENGEIDLKRFKKILQVLDMPFIQKDFDSSVSDKNDTFGTYYKNIALNHLGKSYEDGDNEEFLNTINDAIRTEKELIGFWGRGLEDEEYTFLEDELFKLKTDFECTDYGMEMILKDISFTNLQIYKDRIANKDVQKLIKTRSELMNDGNLKPIQSTGADKNEKVSFGVFAKKYENERPAPTRVDDEMKKYMEIFIPGHLAKMEGLNNETVERYEEELSKYTINFEDIFGTEIEDE